ncbi:unnamed protein product [Didymodactylos carnosus]|uniref:Uncharacterized protein n=1 Tax=Didymodactylos carnosus TaxID=1234261 RepID=A0A814F6X9_9BILA|nr:unnamed protein product [Didymodactylos carnosus]CAF1320080.1 unnamed protein product [Didymodactylos carnosus]CAF3751667.1 unnamed protein product [Didymodactylos carnosus]CAF4129940.1 unnamed protein product [Didymodactylos carnosus]
MGPQPTLILAHSDAVRQFWQFHDEQAVVREVKLGRAMLMLMNQDIGFKSYRDRNRMAKFFHACFGQNRVVQFDADIEFETGKVIDRLDELTVRDHVIDISSELKYLTFQRLCTFFSGSKMVKTSECSS